MKKPVFNLISQIFKFALFILVTSFSTSVSSASYDLTKGDGVEVCEVYKNNLESFNSVEPMVCQRKISKEYEDLEKPHWQPVNLEKHRELFKRLLSYDRTGGKDQFSHQGGKDDEILAHKLNYHKQNDFQYIQRAQFDIDNNGYIDDVLLRKHGQCPDFSAGYFSTNIFLLRSVPSVSDLMLYLENSSDQALKRKVTIDNGKWQSIGVFFFRSRTYIDKYCVTKALDHGCQNDDILMVFSFDDRRNLNKVCEYKVIDE